MWREGCWPKDGRRRRRKGWLLGGGQRRCGKKKNIIEPHIVVFYSLRH